MKDERGEIQNRTEQIKREQKKTKTKMVQHIAMRPRA
ncbi:MAG: hypothetical protein ACI9SC_002324 [Gammaproteobacteria bacterium]|jgi:hypothetical protein